MRGHQKTPGAWQISLRGLSAAPAQSRAARSQSLTSGPASTLVSRSRVKKASRHFAVTLEFSRWLHCRLPLQGQCFAHDPLKGNRGGVLPAGMQAEAVAGQWSYTLGTCAGIQAGDQLWVSRYLLHRLAENFGVIASLDPKPVLPALLALRLRSCFARCLGAPPPFLLSFDLRVPVLLYFVLPVSLLRLLSFHLHNLGRSCMSSI